MIIQMQNDGQQTVTFQAAHERVQGKTAKAEDCHCQRTSQMEVFQHCNNEQRYTLWQQFQH